MAVAEDEDLVLLKLENYFESASFDYEQLKIKLSELIRLNRITPKIAISLLNILKIHDREARAFAAVALARMTQSDFKGKTKEVFDLKKAFARARPKLAEVLLFDVALSKIGYRDSFHNELKSKAPELNQAIKEVFFSNGQKSQELISAAHQTLQSVGLNAVFDISAYGNRIGRIVSQRMGLAFSSFLDPGAHDLKSLERFSHVASWVEYLRLPSPQAQLALVKVLVRRGELEPDPSSELGKELAVTRTKAMYVLIKNPPSSTEAYQELVRIKKSDWPKSATGSSQFGMRSSILSEMAIEHPDFFPDILEAIVPDLQKGGDHAGILTALLKASQIPNSLRADLERFLAFSWVQKKLIIANYRVGAGQEKSIELEKTLSLQKKLSTSIIHPKNLADGSWDALVKLGVVRGDALEPNLSQVTSAQEKILAAFYLENSMAVHFIKDANKARQIKGMTLRFMVDTLDSCCKSEAEIWQSGAVLEGLPILMNDEISTAKEEIELKSKTPIGKDPSLKMAMVSLVNRTSKDKNTSRLTDDEMFVRALGKDAREKALTLIRTQVLEGGDRDPVFLKVFDSLEENFLTRIQILNKIGGITPKHQAQVADWIESLIHGNNGYSLKRDILIETWPEVERMQLDEHARARIYRIFNEGDTGEGERLFEALNQKYPSLKEDFKPLPVEESTIVHKSLSKGNPENPGITKLGRSGSKLSNIFSSFLNICKKLKKK